MKARASLLLFALSLSLLGASGARAASRPSLGAVDSLPSPAGPRSGQPGLAVAPDGTIWMSWIEQPTGTARGPALQTSRLTGRRWSPALTVIRSEELFVNWADPPVLAAMSREGAAIAYPWKRPGVGYAYDLRAAFTSTGGAVWTKPVLVNRDGKAAQHGFVSIVPGADGVELVWLDGRKLGSPKPGREPEGDMTLRAARLDAGGTLSGEVELDGRACDCCNTAAVAVPGGALVAYRDRDPREIRDIALARLAHGRWSAPAPLHHDGWKIDGCPVNGPALDARGTRVVAAWFTMVGEEAKVLVAFSADGGRSFGPPLAVSGGDPLGRVDVALLPDGSGLVSWLDALGQDALLRVQRLWPTGPAADPVLVARTSASRASGFPRMVVSGDRAYFAWVDTAPGPRVRTATARIP